MCPSSKSLQVKFAPPPTLATAKAEALLDDYVDESDNHYFDVRK